MMAAQLVTFSVITLSRSPWMGGVQRDGVSGDEQMAVGAVKLRALAFLDGILDDEAVQVELLADRGEVVRIGAHMSSHTVTPGCLMCSEMSCTGKSSASRAPLRYSRVRVIAAG